MRRPVFWEADVKHFSFDRRLIRGALCVLCGALAALVVVIVGFGGLKNFGRAAKFTAVLRTIRTHFVGEADLDQVTDGALDGAIASLDDNWSYYMDPAEYDAYLDTSANRYQGIGVTITQDEATGGFLVVSVTKDGPAQLAGILPEEIITAVDGVSVLGGTTDQLRALIQADYGREAQVTVLDAGGSERTVAVSCRAIYTSPVAYEMLDGNVGYVDIANFRQGMADEAIAAVDDLIAQGAEGLVFDVRSDPGGLVSELVKLLDHLLPEGDLFIETDKNGREDVMTSDAACVEMPMAVIVNAESYSAAEFFAAALHEYGWAVTVGQPTTGKARSQVTYPLLDGSAIHISTYQYLTPQRADLYEAGGIVPDIAAELTEEQAALFATGWLTPAEDPQVQAAAAALIP